MEAYQIELLAAARAVAARRSTYDRVVCVCLCVCLCCVPFLGFSLAAGKFEQTAAQLRRIATEHAVCGIVVGWPLELSGDEGAMCARVRGFVASLQKTAEEGAGNHSDNHLGALPVVLWDERFSSLQARASLAGSRLGSTRAAKHKAATDRVAAALILQDFVDSAGAV